MSDVLARQLRRLGLAEDEAPDLESWQAFVESVARSYEDADRSRYLLERSLRISSDEMMAMNRALEERTQRRVERSESHYRNLFTRTPVALWEQDFRDVDTHLAELRSQGVKDLAGHLDAHPEVLEHLISSIRTVGFSDAAAHLVRAAASDELLGAFDASVFSTESRASFRPQFQAIWDGVSQVSFDFTGQRLDGETFHGILHWNAPSLDDRHDLERVVVAMVDITERKLAEEALAGLIEAKDEFLASVSHELRTPLTSVYGSAEVLLEQHDLEPSIQRELISFIAQESGELTAMVEDLLVAARADRDVISVRAERLDLRSVVNGVVDSVGRGLDVLIDASEVHGTAWADPLRVRQIVRNLVTNATRYGGPTVRIQSATVGSRVYLTVCDDGAGVAEERHDSIFDLYERGHSDPGLPGSLGIGLSVSRRLATLMGGDLTYDYTGGWSRFRLEIPRRDVTVRRRSPSPAGR